MCDFPATRFHPSQIAGLPSRGIHVFSSEAWPCSGGWYKLLPYLQCFNVVFFCLELRFNISLSLIVKHIVTVCHNESGIRPKNPKA